LTGLPADDAEEIGALFVGLAFFDDVALGAFLSEDFFTNLNF